VFYWAWTISWAPYVGIFIARISKGRTIRQFVGGALGAPLLFTVLWFSVFGLAAIDLELNHGVASPPRCRRMCRWRCFPSWRTTRWPR
jgi:choline/glycine/proline betaine transport protein